MINAGIALLIIAVCFYIGILYENARIVLVGVALGILLVFSMIEVLYRIFTVKCHLEVPISMAEQDMPVSIGVKVQNKGLLSCGKIKVRMCIHNAMEKGKKKSWFFIPGAYRGESRYDFPIILKEAGCHEIEMGIIQFYSLTGLFYFSVRQKGFGAISVMPKIHSLQVQITEPVRNFMGDADVYDDVRPGYDPAETFDIRPYREKDKIQSIHWKLSAKMDELIVKENSLPRACAIVVFLDLQKDKKKAKGKSVSAYIELAASISYALMDAGCPHYVVWNSKEKGDALRVRVDDEESFYIFLNVFLQDCLVKEKTDIRARYKERFRGEYYMYDILLNKDLEIYKNGELVGKIDKAKIADECEKLEILL